MRRAFPEVINEPLRDALGEWGHPGPGPAAMDAALRREVGGLRRKDGSLTNW